MALIITNNGENELLDKMLKDALSSDEDYTLKLFKTDVTPSATSVEGDFTEADFTNYTSKTLTRSGWGAASTVGGKASSTYGSTQSWTCGASGNTIYGYLVVGATSNVLLWAEKFSSSVSMSSGSVLDLTVVFTFNSES